MNVDKLQKSKVFPRTAALNEDGHLVLGGCDSVELAAEFGTPLYVFDEDTLHNSASSFKNAFAKDYAKSEVVYASKAFINVPLARLISAYGLGFDVVSGGELAVLKVAEVDPTGVYFHGNNKTPDELQEALDWGVGYIVVDGLEEITLLNDIATKKGIRQQVLLRVSPGVDPHTHHHTTTGTLDSKFGVPIETGAAEQAVITALGSPGLDLKGLHFHLGSPIFELEPYQKAINITLRFAAEMRKVGLELSRFSPGGGFAIAYTAEDNPPTPDAYASAICSSVSQSCIELGLPEPTLVVEPGRAITGPAGVALYTVGVTKEIPGIRKYVSVDGGMGDNIRPALYDSVYEAVVANKAALSPTETVTIAGKYCESGDILVRDAKLPQVSAGDLIAIPASGAYSPSMASTYNLNGRPAIVLVRDGEATLLRRRETYADLMATDI